jgi:hypothetical protein
VKPYLDIGDTDIWRVLWSATLGRQRFCPFQCVGLEESSSHFRAFQLRWSTVHEEQNETWEKGWPTAHETERTKSQSSSAGYFGDECLLEEISSQPFLLDILRSMAWFSDPGLGFLMRGGHFTTLTSQSRRMGTAVFRITVRLDFPIKSSASYPPATLSFL